MTTWANDELDKIGEAEELRLASVRQDARTIGPRRIGRLATLAAEGYFLNSRRGHRHGKSRHA